MGDLTVSRIRSPVDLAIMVQLDLVMMDLELEVDIKHCIGGIGWNYSVVKAEGEGEFGAYF